MGAFFKQMDEGYKRKRYPKGSFFEAYTKKTTGNQAAGLVFCAAMAIAALFGAWFCNRQMKNLGEDGEEIGKLLIGLALGIALLMLALCVLQISRMLRGKRKMMELCAKSCGYAMSEIEEFERQALQPDTYVLDLSGGEKLQKAKNAMFGQTEGLLTKDYLCLDPGMHMHVTKISDILAAYMVKNTQTAGTINEGRRVRMTFSYLTLNIISSKGTVDFADCTEQAALELLALLKERAPKLDTHGEELLSERQYYELRDKLLKS